MCRLEAKLCFLALALLFYTHNIYFFFFNQMLLGKGLRFSCLSRRPGCGLSSYGSYRSEVMKRQPYALPLPTGCSLRICAEETRASLPGPVQRARL